MRTTKLHAAAAALLGLAGCADVIGLGAYDTTGTGGATTTTTTNEGGTTLQGGGGTGGGASGAGGTGGTGGTTTTSTLPPACEPGTTEPCYEGPPATEGISDCKAGERTCLDTGQWGPCSGHAPVLEVCTTPTDENCDNLATCTGAYRFARRFGGALDQVPTHMATDAAGNLLVAGYVTGEIDFGPGPTQDGGGLDAFLVKLDRDGKHLWSKRFGDAADQALHDVAVDAEGNVFLAGNFYGGAVFEEHPLQSQGDADILVAKLAPDGTYLWHKPFGTPDTDTVAAIAVDANGDLVLFGAYVTTLNLGGTDLDPGAADGDVWVAKLSGADGSHLWSHGYPAAGAQNAVAVAVDPKGDVLLVASGSGNVAFGGPTVTGRGGTDIFAAKLAAETGAHLWSDVFGGSGTDQPTDVAASPDGSFVLAAYADSSDALFGTKSAPTAGLLDIYIWKILADGTTDWVLRQGDDADQYALGVTVDGDGNIAFIGTFLGTLTLPGTTPAVGNFQRLLGKLTPQGTPLWAHQFPSGGGISSAIAVDPLGNVAFTTLLYGTTDFGGGPLTATAADLLIGSRAP